MENIRINQETTITDKVGKWKYVITTYNDVTTIDYFEFENQKWVQYNSISITKGYDLEIFKIALSQRKNLNND